MTQDDLNELRRAAQSLEHPSLAARLTMLAGKPIELIGNALPALSLSPPTCTRVRASWGFT